MISLFVQDVKNAVDAAELLGFSKGIAIQYLEEVEPLRVGNRKIGDIAATRKLARIFERSSQLEALHQYLVFGLGKFNPFEYGIEQYVGETSDANVVRCVLSDYGRSDLIDKVSSICWG